MKRSECVDGEENRDEKGGAEELRLLFILYVIINIRDGST